MLLQFFQPYLTLCLLASWGLAQNLEGLGLFQYLNALPIQVSETTIYPLLLDASVGVAILTFILTVVLATVFILSIRACFYLNKRFGCIGLILWLLPGLLSMFGYIPDIHSVGPEMFLLGSGYLGNPASAAANMFICLIGGWSLILILSSYWGKDNFKNVYDHIWYLSGLSAVLYFVMDAALPVHQKSLTDADNRIVRTLQLFHTAKASLDVLCTLSEPEKLLAPALCELTPDMFFYHLDDDMQENVRAKIEPPEWIATLASDSELARQIEALNKWACVQGYQLEHCRRIPFGIALSTQDINASIVFPPPSYAKKVQQLHASMEEGDRRIHDIKQGYNRRYFIFLLFAILAGGKLANTSRALFKPNSGCTQSWVLISIKYTSRKILILLRRLTMLVTCIYRYFAQLMIALLTRYKEAKTVRLKQREEVVFNQE